MNCKEVEELLSEYIDHELSQEIHDEVYQHLSKCLPCGMLKEQTEELLGSLSKLEEEVPFFLKNRLYYIPESQNNIIEMESGRYFLKWVAAVVGTFLLFLNLFYFTNIYPPANKVLHNVASEIKTLAVKTEAYYEKVKETKNAIISSDEEKGKETDGKVQSGTGTGT